MGDARMPVIPDIPMTPVTAECIQMVSEIHALPEVLLYALLQTEGGAVGHQNKNENGSVDMGPMQINTIWNRQLQGMQVDTTELTNNGCKNIAIGAAILHKYIQEKRDLWKGIGRYNATDKRPDIQDAYSNKVAKAMLSMNKDQQDAILLKVNRMIIRND